ncbi:MULTISPECIES: hypothetical protein [Aeromonas]|uniref:hypothetical protein n=1 Tax=Aeromonas TaxID=642 RepID=UPI001117D94E|nr:MULTISPECIES: hypothetical protein [Aeromonas]MDX7805219.1 hypothetical protein [Aeromonas caviae]
MGTGTGTGGDGGDTGGSPGGDGSLPGDTDNIAGWQYFNHYGYQTVGHTLSKINTNLGKQLTGVNSRLSDLKDYSNQIADNTFKTQLGLSGVNDKLNEALTYIRETPGRIEGTNLYLSRMEADFDLANLQLKKIADSMVSSGGKSGAVSTVDLSAIKGDVASLKAMQQSSMSIIGSILGNTGSMDSNLRNMSGHLGSIDGTLRSMNSTSSSQLGGMQNSLAAIKGMTQQALNSGWGNSGSGQDGSGDFNIDYSQMPGSSSNPLHVAKAEYESPLCSGDASCAFDLEQITKVYGEHKEALKSQYISIKNEMTDMFKYQFYGSASAPKCFDMFSIFGKDYQVCPDSDGYWDFLAALMMFIFYFTAFIILTRR